MPKSLCPARALPVVAVAAFALTACTVSPNSPGETVSAGIQSPASAGVAASAEAGATPLGDADNNMKTLRPEVPAQLLVTEVRTGSHAGFDRIVFEFEGDGDPGWFIDYTETASQLGSGKQVPYTGTVALNVNIDGTVYPNDLGLDDPKLGTTEGSGNITEVISAGMFEGRSQFIVGLTAAYPYSVEVLEDPKRLVIDIVQS